jgi:hypothetical protein
MLVKGILLGVSVSVIAISVYLYWLFHKYPGPGIFDTAFARRPAVFAYGIAVGISIVSTVVLTVIQIGQKILEHKAAASIRY